MTLAPGTRLGPYDLVGQIGAGGMGEVWKARDPKLDRFVAIKVLPEAFFADGDRLRRFQQEARVLASLSHPNVVQVFEAGEHEGAPYLVMELLEGETLRERMRGKPMPAKRAAELAREVAQGLAAAHGKGILHRDLKPENIFITKDGRVKVLDFGLAKVRGTSPDSRIETQAFAEALSEPGRVVGTSGYMSPEQVRGETVDARSDLFSFGVVLWEMVTGRGPFHRGSAIETMHAILKDDPQEPEDAAKPIPPGMRRILDHCLEKEPSRRFHDAQDLAFALENALGSTSVSGERPVLASRWPGRARLWAAILALVLAGGTAGWFLHRPPVLPSAAFKVLTSRRGNIVNARFTPDGQGVVYAAAWEGHPAELFTCRSDGTGTRALGLKQATIQAVNARGDLLVLLKPDRWGSTNSGWGTLALSSLDGGMPKELLERVVQADFGPDGQQVAALIAPGEGGPRRLEYPLGHTLLVSDEAAIGSFRVSPDGEHVAVMLQEAGHLVVALLDRSGARRDLYRSREAFGTPLSWARGGKAVMFIDGNYYPGGSPLLSVDLQGRVTRLQTDSSLSVVWDVSPQGQLLIERTLYRTEVVARRAGRESDLSLGIHTFLSGLSADGEWALLVDRSGAVPYSYLRRTDGAPPKFLGEGAGAALSPDGKWALLLGESQGLARLVPTGLGQARDLRREGMDPKGGVFSPDGRTVWIFSVRGRELAQAMPFDLEGQAGEPVALPSWNIIGISPAGDRFLWADRTGHAFSSPLKAGAATPQSWSLAQDEFSAGWDRPEEVLIRHPLDGTRERVDRLDLATGRRTPFETYVSKDPMGIIRVEDVELSLDRQTVGLTYARVVHSDLLLGEGLVPR